MKSIHILSCVAALLLAAATSCNVVDLDIVPKGMTVLNNTTDLGYLLNQEYSLGASPVGDDLGRICNEIYGVRASIPTVLASKNTLGYAYMAYDESVDRVALSQSDSRYERCYKFINYMNVVIDKVSGFSGEDELRAREIAQAKVLRAYFHYLLVGIYARQYDSSYADKEGGIAYVDNTDVGQTKVKCTLQETYDRILADCSDEVIADLPDDLKNDVCQADKAFGNAVRAKVLFQMKQYDKALPYALEAIKCNDRIIDYSAAKTKKSWSVPTTDAHNYIYMYSGVRASLSGVQLSLETLAKFEPDDFVMKYTSCWNATQGKKTSGLDGVKQYNSFGAYPNVYGIASEKIYYLAAECYIRTGAIKDGLALVDKVRARRVDGYEPFAEMNPMSEKEAMDLLQPAKWVECICTYENFFDCKRWNSEDDYKKSITRDLGEYGKFTIAPDSKLWILPFPGTATQYNKTLTQNF